MRFLLLACFLFAGTVVNAGEKVMHCTSYDTSREYTFKLETSLLSGDQIFQRSEGSWEEWCENETYKDTTTPKSITYDVIATYKKSIGDEGGKCSITKKPENPADAKYVGMDATYIVDFYLKTFVMDVHSLIYDDTDSREFKWKFTCELLE